MHLYQNHEYHRNYEKLVFTILISVKYYFYFQWTLNFMTLKQNVVPTHFERTT